MPEFKVEGSAWINKFYTLCIKAEDEEEAREKFCEEVEFDIFDDVDDIRIDNIENLEGEEVDA